MGGEYGACNFYVFTTNNYKLYYFEIVIGLCMMFIMDVCVGDF